MTQRPVPFPTLYANQLLIDSSTDGDALPPSREEWIVRSALTRQYFQIPLGSSLKQLFIGSFTLRSLRRFELSELNELENVKIGWNSFTRCNNEDMNRTPGGFFLIEQCPRLKTIEIGEYSFSDFEHFTINHLPALETIHIEGSSFYYASSIVLMVRIRRNAKEDLPLLRTLYLGSVTGYSCHAVSFCSKAFHPFVMRSSPTDDDSARLRVILWK